MKGQTTKISLEEKRKSMGKRKSYLQNVDIIPKSVINEGYSSGENYNGEHFTSLTPFDRDMHIK